MAASIARFQSLAAVALRTMRQPASAPNTGRAAAAAAPWGFAGGDEPTRVACHGDLSARSFAADLLDCAIDWAESHPDRRLEIIWTGDGDLRGILAAQPEPPNLTQRFPGSCGAAWLGDGSDAPDVIVTTHRRDAPDEAVRAALAAGARVVCGGGGAEVRRLAALGLHAWRFDPGRPASLLAALSGALRGGEPAGFEPQPLRRPVRDGAGARGVRHAAVLGDAPALPT